MFEAPLFNGPRTWKYALPGFLVVALIPVIGKMMLSPNPDVQYLVMIPIGLCVLFTIMFLVNLWKYMSTHAEEMYSEHQSALSRTPLVMLAEAMRQMHPEAVKVLNRFGVRTSWEVRLNAETWQKDWVLAGTNAHFGFIEFVLLRSGKALYPKRSFAEGSHKWDPDGVTEDREQYDDLERWLFARTMITRFYEYKPAEFLPPWTPQLIMEAMGLSGEQDLYKPEEAPRKDLGATQQVPVSSNGSNGQNGKKKEEERPLTDEEWQAIQTEMVAYSSNGNLKGDAQ